MNENLNQKAGWRAIPLALKILSVVMVLWALGAIMNMPKLAQNGLPLFGTFVYGSTAMAVVILLDIIGPLVFLYGLWHCKSWAPKWAFAYIGIFILNGIVAFFTVQVELGMAQILVPNIAALVFVSVIFWKKDYFSK